MDASRARVRRLGALRHRIGDGVDALVTALALATGAGLLGVLVRPGRAIHEHWLGSGTWAVVVSGLFVGAVLSGARMRRRFGAPGSWAVAIVVAATAVGATVSAVGVSRAVARGAIGGVGAWPSASAMAAALLVVWLALGRARVEVTRRRGSGLRRVASVAVAGAALVTAWIGAVGSVDYGVGRRADAIVVFGSKVHADGRPSGSLVDRTITACRLWQRGAAPVLVFSGGRDAGAVCSEPEAMKALAVAEGVSEAAIVLDERGDDSAATVANVAALARERAWGSVLAVSHDYHLARIRLLFERQGLSACTVPARETCPSAWKLAAIPREVAAWSVAWMR